MTIDEDLSRRAALIQECRKDVTQRLHQLTEVPGLSDTMIESFSFYLENIISSAQSTLKLCSTISADYTNSNDSRRNELTNLVKPIIQNVTESMAYLVFSMTIVEYLALGSGEHPSFVTTQHGDEDNPSTLNCSFCNKKCEGNEVVAGPSVNICSSCVRLACGALGI